MRRTSLTKFALLLSNCVGIEAGWCPLHREMFENEHLPLRGPKNLAHISMCKPWYGQLDAQVGSTHSILLYLKHSVPTLYKNIPDCLWHVYICSATIPFMTPISVRCLYRLSSWLSSVVLLRFGTWLEALRSTTSNTHWLHGFLF